MDRSFVGKGVVIFSLTVTIFILFYYAKDYGKLVSTRNSLVSSLTKSRQLSSNQCALSMKESDDWFCESDIDWIRRKRLYHLQNKVNHNSDKCSLFFQNNWEPTVHCEFERRLGATGDGGKWVCDIHRFRKKANTTLLIYSMGSGTDFSFEQAVKHEYPEAEIHTFDNVLSQCPDKLCTFHQVSLGDGKNNKSTSLQLVAKELGHQGRQIHILKIDIEGGEFSILEELLKNSKENQPYIRQILCEIHLNSAKTGANCRRAHELFELFHSNSYVIFHKEANVKWAQDVFEYGVLRLNPAFFTRG